MTQGISIYACCFCGDGIEEKGFDVVKLTLTTTYQSDTHRMQNFFCHLDFAQAGQILTEFQFADWESLCFESGENFQVNFDAAMNVKSWSVKALVFWLSTKAPVSKPSRGNKGSVSPVKAVLESRMQEGVA